jgi:RNA recognition motif-containing protein
MGRKGESQVSETERTVFVSGIPYVSNEEEIQGIFEECGEIEYHVSIIVKTDQTPQVSRHRETVRLWSHCI